MLIDFSQSLKNIKGEFLDVNGKTEKEGGDIKTPLLLKDLCVKALLHENFMPNQVKSSLDPSEKLKCYQLAVKIENSIDPLDISTDDIVKIKNKMADIFPPLLCGQATEMLEKGVVY